MGACMGKEQINSRIPILIVGATGQLGVLLTKNALANPILQVNILVRDPQKNKELAAQVEKAGGRVIKGDLGQPETITNVTRGMHTVISVLSSYDEKAYVDGHIALIQDSLNNGVERFVPSDFGVNYTKFSKNELNQSPIVGYKIKVRDFLDKQKGIKVLSFWPGSLLETFFYFQSQGFSYWGDVNRKYDYTSFEDLAKFMVAAIAKRDLTGELVVRGSELTITQVAEIYNKVRGTNVQPKRAGSLNDLRKLYEEKKSQGDAANAGLLGLFLIISDERSKFPKNDNSRFPEVKTTSLEEFLKQNPSINLKSL